MDKGEKELLLGIDLGTSSVKVLVLDGEGKVIETTQRSYDLIRSRKNRVEQVPQDWWQAVLQAVDELKVQKKNIEAIGLSGQLNGLCPVDEKGSPLDNALIWLDQRAEREAEMLKREYGAEIWAQCYTEPAAMLSLSKILWIKSERPDLYAKTYKFLFPKDYITHCLTGDFVTDVTDAGAAAMLNLEKRDWAHDLLGELMDRQKLPLLFESKAVVGETEKEVSRILGVKPGTPVVAGAGDMAALALGTGVMEENTACATIGTAGHIASFLPQLPREGEAQLWVMCHAIPEAYFWHGLVMTGGYCLSWFKDNFATGEKGQGDGYKLLLDRASSVPPGSAGLIFLPFLSGAATPFMDFSARGAFIGADSAHTRAHFTRAVLEGVAYNFRDSLEIIEKKKGFQDKELMVGEGGSQHYLWPKIMADVLGRQVTVLEELNSSALGAAILAGVGGGVWSSFTEAKSKAIRIRGRNSYNEKNHGCYNRYYQTYTRSYEQLQEIFHELAGLRG